MDKFFLKKLIFIIFGAAILSLFFSLGLNYSQSSNYSVNDEFLGPPWQPVPNKDYSDQQYNLDLINAYQAWQVDSFDNGVTIAIIDSGIDTDHEEFVGKISSISYNTYTDEVGVQYVEDDLGHGTNVAGVIGAKIGNDLGIDGIINNVDLMIIKVNVPGEEGYSNSLIREGIYYAVNNGADVINMSLGSTYLDSSIQEAVNYAYENEVFVVAAAGNDGTETMYYPAALENVISVGSINSDVVLSDFSNYGNTIDLVAPGELIYTTDLNNGYAQVSGTSFAAPHVAAVLGLLVSYGEYSFEEINENFKNSSKDLGVLGKDNYYGYGMIDAYQALITDLVKISFETFTDDFFAPIWIVANQPYSIIFTPEKEHYLFDGWYIDSEFVSKLSTEYIYTEDVVLFASYKPIMFTVTFILDDVILQTMEIQSGNSLFDFPIVSDEDKIFYGWYFETDFLNKYLDQTILENTILYGYLDDPMYVLTFLNYDNSFYTEIILKAGEEITLLENPEKPSDDLFSYVFVSWSHSLESIQSNLTLTPIYSKELLPGVAILNPSIDTIYSGDEWLDSGLYFSNSELSYTVSNTVDTNTIGSYIVEYSILYQNELVGELIRYVNVIEKLDVKIDLNKAISTIILGNDYVERGATSNIGNVNIIGSVDTSKVGRYIIKYQVIHNDIVYEKSRYIYVIDPDFIPIDDIDWYLEKGESYEE